MKNRIRVIFSVLSALFLTDLIFVPVLISNFVPNYRETKNVEMYNSELVGFNIYNSECCEYASICKNDTMRHDNFSGTCFTPICIRENKYTPCDYKCDYICKFVKLTFEVDNNTVSQYTILTARDNNYLGMSIKDNFVVGTNYDIGIDYVSSRIYLYDPFIMSHS